jgi:hypothetical protein
VGVESLYIIVAIMAGVALSLALISKEEAGHKGKRWFMWAILKY